VGQYQIWVFLDHPLVVLLLSFFSLCFADIDGGVAVMLQSEGEEQVKR